MCLVYAIMALCATSCVGSVHIFSSTECTPLRRQFGVSFADDAQPFAIISVATEATCADLCCRSEADGGQKCTAVTYFGAPHYLCALYDCRRRSCRIVKTAVNASSMLFLKSKQGGGRSERDVDDLNINSTTQNPCHERQHLEDTFIEKTPLTTKLLMRDPHSCFTYCCKYADCDAIVFLKSLSTCLLYNCNQGICRTGFREGAVAILAYWVSATTPPLTTDANEGQTLTTLPASCSDKLRRKNVQLTKGLLIELQLRDLHSCVEFCCNFAQHKRCQAVTFEPDPEFRCRLYDCADWQSCGATKKRNAESVHFPLLTAVHQAAAGSRFTSTVVSPSNFVKRALVTAVGNRDSQFSTAPPGTNTITALLSLQTNRKDDKTIAMTTPAISIPNSPNPKHSSTATSATSFAANARFTNIDVPPTITSTEEDLTRMHNIYDASYEKQQQATAVPSAQNVAAAGAGALWKIAAILVVLVLSALGVVGLCYLLRLYHNRLVEKHALRYLNRSNSVLVGMETFSDRSTTL